MDMMNRYGQLPHARMKTYQSLSVLAGSPRMSGRVTRARNVHVTMSFFLGFEYILPIRQPFFTDLSKVKDYIQYHRISLSSFR
jgi:hypothetical protein